MEVVWNVVALEAKGGGWFSWGELLGTAFDGFLPLDRRESLGISEKMTLWVDLSRIFV